MLTIERQIFRQIRTIARSISYIRQVQFKQYGLGRGKHAFLTRVMEYPGLNQEQLTQMLKLDKTTVAKALDKLEKQGFVERRREANDRRVWLVYPTEKMVEFYPTMNQLINDDAETGAGSLTAQEREQLVLLLQKVNVAIDKLWFKARNKRT